MIPVRPTVIALALTLSCAWGLAAAQTDLAPLFAPATPAEVAAVRADWAARPTEAGQFSHERSAEVEGFTLTRASFVFEGYKQYGLVRYPRHYDPAGSFPVLVLHHGGEQGLYYMNGITFDETFPRECLADSAFVLMPTYRGEAFAGSSDLGNQYSEGEVSLWDRDCDDAMAMLTAFLAVTPEADAHRVTSLGRSRGATVAYHMAVRDPRLRRSAILFGASDFFHPDIQADCNAEVNDDIVATNTLSRKVMANVVAPWLDGSTTLAEARHLLIGWSIIYTLDGNLSLQVHHGQLDESIPIDHAVLVDERMQMFGAGPPEFEFFSYPLAGHNTSGMVGYEERVENYLWDLPYQAPSGVPFASDMVRLAAWPNPFTAGVTVTVLNDSADKVSPPVRSLQVVDLRGRLVRRLDNSGPSGRAFFWDGEDHNGHPVPAGVYLVIKNDPDQKAGVDIQGKRILKLR